MNCIQGNIGLIDQILTLIESMDDTMIQSKLPAFAEATIGQHFRHIFDFYECLLSSHSQKQVDYACRSRDSEIERDLVKLKKSFESLKVDFECMDPATSLCILSDFATDQNEERVFVKSTVGRELMYAFDHAVHHLAIIKIGMRVHFPQVYIDPDLGKAPSTVKYQQASQNKS